MEICNSGHEEVVHNERNCPACELMDLVKNLERDVENLNERINEMEQTK